MEKDKVVLQNSRWVCPNCGHSNKVVSNEFGYKAVKCVKCQKEFEVNNLKKDGNMQHKSFESGI
jgi:DNA-directed RNA polymerase subunit RPC12/RpoP